MLTTITKLNVCKNTIFKYIKVSSQKSALMLAPTLDLCLTSITCYIICSCL